MVRSNSTLEPAQPTKIPQQTARPWHQAAPRHGQCSDSEVRL